MHDDDEYISINTNDVTLGTYDTVTIPSVSMAPSTITLSMPEEDLFVKTPDYDSRKVKQELGIDMIQELKRSFGE
ncbi:MAG: hypothetical protein CBE00_13390 [Planctomycetaceae bacterium TMED240]|nr:MAG: hypothetical protein CBE00_13390 [Planctomycetaceae bacterium TMED240]